MAKRRPKTGDKRLTRQPLNIDRLPTEMHDRILFERTRNGRTWLELEALSPTFTKEWEKVAPEIQQLFPGLRLPKSNLHRWYDLRVEQVQQESQLEVERARAVAESFAHVERGDLDAAVTNALTDQIFALTENVDERSRKALRGDLIKLGRLLVQRKRAEIQEKQAETEQARVELLKQKLDKLTNDAAKKLEKGQQLTKQDIDRIRERTFGLPPA
ncbi:MAG TPA: phage protein Gp27 family protein [Clostridia bacterium]|nr:phage protein Gp27 family protein [Clostridia bacterium]